MRRRRRVGVGEVGSTFVLSYTIQDRVDHTFSLTLIVEAFRCTGSNGEVTIWVFERRHP